MSKGIVEEGLREPVRDWRDTPSLQDTVLKHFGLLKPAEKPKK